MRFLIDAQLPPALARLLEANGQTAEHVSDIGLRHAEDSPIWAYAMAHQAIIITKDEDFAQRTRQAESSRSSFGCALETPVAAPCFNGSSHCSRRSKP